ncbi:hypothetical protein ACGFWI_37915 [Streptomyces sp. NPDC048434]|uniref:hypothetical protein n=1 Tax=Streptomyces sp. NPDC048434 TaxID=3365549 RepID=UPI0037206E77
MRDLTHDEQVAVATDAIEKYLDAVGDDAIDTDVLAENVIGALRHAARQASR